MVLPKSIVSYSLSALVPIWRPRRQPKQRQGTSTESARGSYRRQFGSKRLVFLFAWLTGAVSLEAQALPSRQNATTAIQDNSFLVEEAYNQEQSVVQHIGTFSRAVGSRDWVHTFTQEWPVRGQRHQMSYTIPLAHKSGQGSARTGIGDVAVNYRYQMRGIDGGPAFAPRVTVVLPTGASRRGFGTGGTKVQVNLPFSATLPARLVAHSNAGMSFTPRARDTADAVAAIREYSLGQSLIWLAHPRLNLMLEATWTRAREVAGPDRTTRSSEILVAPGIRGAIDFASGLQIVPGLALPIGVGPSRGERRVFAYLSFEHPYAKRGP